MKVMLFKLQKKVPCFLDILNLRRYAMQDNMKYFQANKKEHFTTMKTVLKWPKSNVTVSIGNIKL